jgi:Na+/H+ antiporter NhaD/arsenite permease-like protein
VTGDALLAVTLLIFAVTYLVLAIGRLPFYRLDRAGAALLGASLMVAVGTLSLKEAYAALDLDTITLLLGMMIVVANLKLSGFFQLAGAWVAGRAGHPLVLLAGVTLVAGFFSAFLVNDTICLAMTPLVLELALLLGRNPVPYLLAVAMASNVGSVATTTGNPQNIMIGSLSHIPYGSFAAALAPVAAVGLLLTVLLIALAYRAEFWTRERLRAVRPRVRYNRPLVLKSVAVTLVMVVLFFAGQPIAKVAIVAGGFLLLTRRVKSSRIRREIDGGLLLMFAGLFVVVAGLDKVALTQGVMAAVGRLHLDQGVVLGTVTALLSNLVSNVPAVLVMRPFIPILPDPRHAWLVVAMASTLAGNLTILGSVANLIVVQSARARHVEIGFWEHLKVGVPLTILTIAVGILWLGGP